MKKIIILVVFFSMSVTLFATNYYVSNTGIDSNNGTTTSTAWLTITKVNSTTLVAGDSVFFQRGGSWRETLAMAANGAKGNHIYFGAYGTGARPRIMGSTALGNWTATGTANIWQSGVTLSNNPQSVGYGAQIFFRHTTGADSWGYYRTYTTGYTNLTVEYDWTYNGGVVYIYATSDPDERYVGVEAPIRENGITINSHEYLTFDNLFIGYLSSAGLRDAYASTDLDDITVTNCEIAYIGYKNSSMAFGLSLWHSNAYYAYNEIHDCGRRGISINMYDYQPTDTMRNVVIEHNHFYNGWHTTGVDCINSGEHVMDSLIVRNNYFEGDTQTDLTNNPNSNFVMFADQSTNSVGVVSNVYIYNNIFSYAHGKSIQLEMVDTAHIIYNTIYGYNPTLDDGQPQLNLGGAGNSQIEVKNNIFYIDLTESFNAAVECIFVNAPANVTASIDYNLYYATDANKDILEFFQTGSYDREYTMSEFSAYRSQYPTYDTHSPTPANPNLTSPSTGDFSLVEGSPAIGSGSPIAWITTDYNGNPRNSSTSDIGALVYTTPSSEPSNATDIITFTINGQSSSEINTTDHTVTVILPYGVDRTSLSPTITVSPGATISPTSGVSRNFTSTVTYTVTAQDETTTQSWNVTVINKTQPQIYQYEGQLIKVNGRYLIIK